MSDAMADETISGNGEPGTAEAEALAAALNHSAERVQTLWFSFLTFMLYLAVATGTTTHRMLFLESPFKLPVLNIDLPLLGFYILTPVIFVVFHFYMLLNLVLLARTARTFEDALMRAFPEDGEARETFRMRIENTLFVQLLVGGRLEREGLNAKLLSWMALITLALAPVALILMFEVKFLPYHSEAITWLHRGVLVLDLALVWTLWPGYRSGWGVRLRPKTSWRLVVPGLLSTAALAYAVVVATLPDKRMYLAIWVHGPTYLDPNSGKVLTRYRPNWYALISPIDTLALRGEDLIDDAQLKGLINKNESLTGWLWPRWVATLSLAGRDLRGADLSRADIRHVDFSGAILNRADLQYAWAREANFDDAQLQGALLVGAELQGASLKHAQLQGASLEFAQLQGAALDGSDVVSLVGPYGAQLQGASLDEAQLQGASLDGAQLQGASLENTNLQGASLKDAKLQGAWLLAGQLQGASLENVKLQGASFAIMCLWRSDARQAAWGETVVKTGQLIVKMGLENTGLKVFPRDECEWTVASLAALRQLIVAEVPEGENKRAAMERIEQRLDPTKALESEDEMAKIWAARESESPSLKTYAKSLAGQWRELGCAAEGAPYVLHALIPRFSDPDSSLFGDQSDAAESLASAFLDEAHFPGAHGIWEEEKAVLKKLASPAAPPAPKP